jgi:hypothetical protein
MLNRRDLLIFTGKVLLAWSVMTGLIVFAGGFLVTPLFPLFRAVVIAIESGFSPSLKFIPSVDGGQVKLTVWVMQNIPVATGIVIRKGIELTAASHVLHLLVPVVVLLSILTVWPIQDLWQKGLLILLGLLFSIGVLLATAPVLWVALLELPFQEQALAANAQHTAPWFMDWMIFSEMGGALLLALTGVWVCIRLQRWVWRLRTSDLPKVITNKGAFY